MIELLSLPGHKAPPTSLDAWVVQLSTLGGPVTVTRDSPGASWLEVGPLRLRGYAMLEGGLVGAINFELTDPDPSPAERLGHSLHPWTSFGIVPVFALANAGVALPAGGLAAALGHPVAAGAVAGLLIGKLLGISLASYLAVRTGLAVLPSGVGWGSIVGVAALGGIGFTVSLFITELAFTERALADAAKVGVLAGSTLAAALGCLLLMVILARTNGDGSWPDTTVGEGAHDGP